jgi:hypothetical protein
MTKETVAVVLEAEHLALVRAFAQREGRSTSNALRRIIDEWARNREQAARLAADALCAEEARATAEPYDPPA